MNYREVYDIAMPMSKREAESKNYWVAFVIRPLSVLFTIPLLKTKVKPITVTLWSVCASILGAAFLAFGDSLSLKLLGFLFFFIWAVLDGVDGNLARCHNSCSKLGELWDAFGGYTTLVLVFFSAGLSAYYENNSIEVLDKYWYLVIGGATSVISIFPRLIYQKKKAIAPEFDVKASFVEEQNKISLFRLIQLNLSISGGMQVLLLIAILTHAMNLFLFLYFLENFSMMLISLRGLLKE